MGHSQADEDIAEGAVIGRRYTIEECAKLAENQYDEQPRRAPRMDDDGSYDIGWRSACDHIAKKIRALSRC